MFNRIDWLPSRLKAGGTPCLWLWPCVRPAAEMSRSDRPVLQPKNAPELVVRACPTVAESLRSRRDICRPLGSNPAGSSGKTRCHHGRSSPHGSPSITVQAENPEPEQQPCPGIVSRTRACGVRTRRTLPDLDPCHGLSPSVAFRPTSRMRQYHRTGECQRAANHAWAPRGVPAKEVRAPKRLAPRSALTGFRLNVNRCLCELVFR